MAKRFSSKPKSTQISVVDYNTRLVIEEIMHRYLSDLSNSHWHGSAYGIPSEDLDDVAEDIMTKFDLWEKNDE